MAEWLYEPGVGEDRAALVDGGVIVQARIELHDGALRIGTVAAARLRERVGPAARVALDRGGEAMLAPVPTGLTQGAALMVEIVRTAMPDAARTKPPRAVPAAPDAMPSDGPDLLARITASGVPVRLCRTHEPDLFEQTGWSEVLDEALRGEISFAGGALWMAPTPAMTLFDVDGSPPLEPLAVAAAHAVGAAIVRHGIGGSIGIDFPTLAGKAPRQAVAAAIDSALAGTGPFERTTVNGFGFLQIVRRRTWPSLPELLRADPAGAEARAILRRIERTPPPGPADQPVPATVLAWLAARPHLGEVLARRTGVVPRFTRM